MCIIRISIVSRFELTRRSRRNCAESLVFEFKLRNFWEHEENRRKYHLANVSNNQIFSLRVFNILQNRKIPHCQRIYCGYNRILTSAERVVELEGFSFKTREKIWTAKRQHRKACWEPFRGFKLHTHTTCLEFKTLTFWRSFRSEMRVKPAAD